MALRDKLQRLSGGREGIDRDQVIEAWVELTDQLFARIRRDLSEYEAQGLARFETKSATRDEEGLGHYAIRELIFISGPEAIVFSPGARFVMGAEGRVDVYRQGHRLDGAEMLYSGTILGGYKWTIAVPDPRVRSMSALVRPMFPPSEEVYSKESLERLIDTLLS